MTNDFINYTLPEWAQQYVEYGEDTSLTQDETDQLDVFLSSVTAQHGEGYWSWPDEGQTFFTYRSDLDNMGSNCVNVRYVLMETTC
jgi:hypothetical protein